MKDVILVAAHDAPDEVKAEADFVCDGVDDEVEIRAAVLAAQERGLDDVRLSPGTFYPGPETSLPMSWFAPGSKGPIVRGNLG